MRKTEFALLSAALFAAAFVVGYVGGPLLTAVVPPRPEFYIDAEGNIAGTRFAAEGYWHTATHVDDTGDAVGVDTERLGPAPFRGYEICYAVPPAGTAVEIALAPWPGGERLRAVVATVVAEGYVVLAADGDIRGGYSGSPALWNGRVFGTLSTRNANQPGVTRISLFKSE